jgi:hypothetical protein
MNFQNTFCFGVDEGERIDPIATPQRPNSTPPIAAPVVAGSFPDIVTSIDIVQSIYQAPSVSTGLSFEYMCLIEELRCFEDTLRFVDRLLTTIPMNESIHQAIEIETTSCREQLEKFLVNCKAEEVERFRRKLSHHRQNINRFLCGLQM